MLGDYGFIILIDLIAIAFITIGATIVNGLNNVSAGYLSKEETLQNAYNSIKIASMISLYVGIAVLVIVTLTIAWLYVPIKVPLVATELIKIFFGAGIIITAVIIAAVYYTNAYTAISTSEMYRIAANSKVKYILNETLSFIRTLIQFYYGIAIVTFVIFVAMVIYDVSKKKDNEDDDLAKEIIMDEIYGDSEEDNDNDSEEDNDNED